MVVANATHATTDVTLAPPATVAGHVTDTSAAPIPALQVFLLEPVWGSVRATATTDATGAYALPAVPATWRIRFHDPQGAFPDWYTGGSPTWAASSTITLGAGTTTLDLQLAHNPEVSGTVTGSGSGPLAGIVVLAVAADRSVVASTTTAADGTYTFVVPVGPTRLRFFDPSGTWALQYAGPAGPFDEATVLDAVAEGHHTVDMAMVAGAGLSGQVTVGTFGPGAPTVAVLAFDDQYFDLVGGASVAADGTWTMRGLPPGPTKLLLIDHRLEGGLETAYRPVFSGDRDVIAEGLGPSFTAAAAFTASSGTTTPTGTMGVVGYHCDPTVAVPGADLRTTFGAGLGVPVNLDGCDLHGADLRGTTLTGSLRYADLSHADLSDAVLGTSAMVPYVDVVYTKGDLTGAKITGANLHHAWAFNTQLLAANPDWTGTDLRADTHKPSGVVGGIDSWPVFWGGTGPTLVGGYAAHPLTPASSVPYSGSPLVLDGAVMEHVLFGSMPGITITGLTCSSCLFGTYDITQAKAINADLHGASFPNLTCDQCTFVHADLRNADLTGAVCTGCDLEAADPRGAQMGGADLTGANIRNVFFRQTLGLTGPQLLATNGDWYGVDIGGLGLDFSGGTFPAGAQMSATLWGNDFAGANLFGRSLQYADLHGVDLHGANLSFADLSYANLAGANLHGANVTGAVFTGANLTGADTGGWVTSTNLSGLDLRGTDFSNKDLTGFSFVGSDLRGAKFDFAKLVNADLHGANAAGATFNSATWTGADVTGTDLTGALLSGGAFGSVTGFTSGQLLSASKYWAGIDLTGTGFSFSGFDFKTPGYVIEGSKLSGLDLSGATIPAHADGVTWAGANLSGLHASGTSFAYANLAGANLAGADLSNTFTLNTDLTGATLTGATVTGASPRRGRHHLRPARHHEPQLGRRRDPGHLLRRRRPASQQRVEPRRCQLLRDQRVQRQPHRHQPHRRHLPAGQPHLGQPDQRQPDQRRPQVGRRPQLGPRRGQPHRRQDHRGPAVQRLVAHEGPAAEHEPRLDEHQARRHRARPDRHRLHQRRVLAHRRVVPEGEAQRRQPVGAQPDRRLAHPGQPVVGHLRRGQRWPDGWLDRRLQRDHLPRLGGHQRRRRDDLRRPRLRRLSASPPTGHRHRSRPARRPLQAATGAR